MKKSAMPRTPFSTPLSGSARETEIRLKNIFSGPKKRPPLLFLALMFFVCIFCGNLVSCQMAEPEKGDAPARLENSQSGDNSIPEPPAVRAVPVDPDNPPKNGEEEWLLQALFQAAGEQEEFQLPKSRLLTLMQGDGYVLGAAFVEDHLENTLILGIMNQETRELDGPVFRCSLHSAVANVAVFQNYGGEDCLLYTFTGQMMGQYFGEAGVVHFDGRHMNWEWPVEGDVRYPIGGVQAVRGAYEPYQEYWTGHLALMAPGGVDIYTVNPEFEWGKDEPVSMWQLETDELFYSDPSSAAELPMPIYFDALRWLIEYTGNPGGWRIVSLTLDEALSTEGMDCFTLQVQEALGSAKLNAGRLFFPYEPEGGRKFYGNLDHAEVDETYQALLRPRAEP